MRSHFTKPARHRAFTLIELLVVVLIIAILAALGFVATGKIRDRALESTAINSLRQVGIAHIGYATENHGAINTINGTDAEEGSSSPSNSFWGRMQPYLFTGVEVDNLQQMETALNAMFQTQNARDMSGTLYSGIPEFQEAGLPVPIGFNKRLEPVGGQHIRMAIFNNPARVIYSAYGREFFDSTHGATFTSMPQNGGPGGPGIYYLENKVALVCFLDGHVEKLTPPISERLFAEIEESSD